MHQLDLFLLAFVCFIAMVSPGPDFMLVTKNALTRPRAQALATAFGIVSGCIIHSTLCVLGLALLITQSTTTFQFLKYAGACYLVYLGARALFAKSSKPLSSEAVPGAPSRTVGQSYVEGLLCNLLNPKLAMFLLSLFTQFISPDATTAEKAMVAVIFVLESAVYWPLLVFLLQRSAIQRGISAVRPALERIFGAILLGLGVKVAFSR